MADAEQALGNILAQIRAHDHAQKRQMQHICRQQRQRDGDEPQRAEIKEHSRERIAAGAEHTHDLHIADVAEADLQRTEHRHGKRRFQRQRRERLTRGEDRHQRMPQQDHKPADDNAQQRHEHGKPPCILHTAADLAAADGLADHDDAGVAHAHIKREGKLGKRLENGHTGVIFIAHVGIHHVEHQNAHRP